MNHSHVWNAGSSEAERKRGTNFDREPGTGECERVTRWLSDAISVLTSVRPSLRTDTIMNSTSALEIYTWCHSGKTAEILKRHNQRQPPEYKLQQHAVEIPRLQQPTHAAFPHLHGNQQHSHLFPLSQDCRAHLIILPTHSRWLKSCNKTELHLTFTGASLNDATSGNARRTPRPSTAPRQQQQRRQQRQLQQNREQILSPQQTSQLFSSN